MSRRFALSAGPSILLVLLAVPVFAAAADGPAKTEEKPSRRGIEFFETKIRPVLVKHCYECHSAKSEEVGGELLLDTRDGLREGGESGHGVVPGDVDASLIITAMEYGDFEMPPEAKLPPEVIADFRRWVKMGAPDPRRKRRPAVAKPDAAPAAPLWSLAPLADPAPPKVADKLWPRGDIDRFVLAKLEEQKLQPVATAEPQLLLRRLYFDLIGLPPPPKEVQAAADGLTREAYIELVDRLLASPQFGERWGRHWLDVVRYAESAGSSRDVLMPYAWRYRDYVIDAFNADIPFDRFIAEQVAGDLLAASEPADKRRLLIATGMLAIGQKSLNGGNVQMDLVDDQIDVVSRAFVGLTASCARCHDHKFDPIPTADYYAMAGVFRSMQTLYGGSTKRPKTPAEAAKVYLTLGEDAGERLQQLTAWSKQIANLNKRRAAMEKNVKSRLAKLPKDWQRQQAEFSKEEGELTPKQTALREQIAAYRKAQANVRELQQQAAALRTQSSAIDLDFAVGVREAARPADCRLHKRGDPKNLGEPIPRGFLSCVEIGRPAGDSQPTAAGGWNWPNG